MELLLQKDEGKGERSVMLEGKGHPQKGQTKRNDAVSLDLYESCRNGIYNVARSKCREVR